MSIPSNYYTTLDHRHFWNSTEVKPSGTDITKGATGLEIDTRKVYRWDGTTWTHYPGGGDTETMIVDATGSKLFTEANPGNVIIPNETIVNAIVTFPVTQDVNVTNAALEKMNTEHDIVTGGKKVINTDHHYVHYGIANKAFIILNTVEATPIEYAFKTPIDKYPHFKNLSLTALGGTCRVSLRRGTVGYPLVIDSPGDVPIDVIGPNNLNDVYVRSNASVITKTPTFVGSQIGEPWIFLQVVGDATNQYTSVAKTQVNDNEECVMDKDTYYVIRIERIGTDSPTNIFIDMFWYEEDHGSLTI